MPTISFGARSFALIATGLALFALFALHEACPGQAPARQERAAMKGRAGTPSLESADARAQGAAAQPSSAITLLDFPPGADAPAGPYATRPRRPVRLATQLRASSATLLQATGGEGFHLDAPATKGHGVRLHLTIAQSEEELVSLLLRGGDDGGADFIALSLERFLARLPDLTPAAPKIFLLLANSRGADSLFSTSRISSLGDLRGRRIAHGRSSAGLYFLTWRLLREGIAPDAVELRPATSPEEALRWLRDGQVEAALLQEIDLALARGGDPKPDPLDERPTGATPASDPETGAPAPAEESLDEPLGDAFAIVERGGERPPQEDSGAPVSLHRLASTADAPRLVPQVLIGRGAFLARYPEMARRTARALLSEAMNAAEDPLPAARRLLEQAPALPDPRAAIRLDPPASLAENRAFFGLDGATSPIDYEALFASLQRVLHKRGAAVVPGKAEDFFWEVPLRKLSTRALASGRGTAQRIAPARAAPPSPAAKPSAESELAPPGTPTPSTGGEAGEDAASSPASAPVEADDPDEEETGDGEEGAPSPVEAEPVAAPEPQAPDQAAGGPIETL